VTVVLVAAATGCVGRKGGNDTDPVPPRPQAELSPAEPPPAPTVATTTPATTGRRAAPTTTTTTAPAPTTTTAAAAGPPYAVGAVTTTYVDPTRPTPARGTAPRRPDRTLRTVVRYPAAAPVGTPEGQLPPARGPFPLIVFAHGYSIDTAAYSEALHTWAAAGYVVAAPELPLHSTALPGPAIESDIVNQPADLGVVIAELTATSGRPGPFQGMVDPARIAAIGHSDGGNTVAAMGANACCVDPRVKAIVAYAPEQAFFTQPWFATPNPPLLVVHGTADTITRYANGKAIADGAAPPAYLLSVQGGDHEGALRNPAVRAQVDPVVLDFLAGELSGDAAALARFHVAGDQPPLTLTGSP
jgi:alpha-beta hydrolase superfamily lysophospholipase